MLWAIDDPSQAAFLNGDMKYCPLNLIEDMYCHPSSQPSYRSEQLAQRQLAVTPNATTRELRYARPYTSIANWALKQVGEVGHKELGRLVKRTKGGDATHARASTNGRGWKTYAVR